MNAKKAKAIGEACVMINGIRHLLAITRNDKRVEQLEKAQAKLMEIVDK